MSLAFDLPDPPDIEMKNRPDSIPVPSADQYLNIRYLFENIDCRLPGEERDVSRLGPHIEDEVVFASKIEKPSMVSTSMIASLNALTDQSFEAICAVLRPRINNEVITSKNSLADMAARSLDSLADEFQGISGSLDQAQCFLLSGSRPTHYAKWGQLANLYNESDAGQKEAIFRYFAACHNRDLGLLLTTPAFNYVLPASLKRDFESKTIDGDVAMYDQASERWLREDVFKHQYVAFGIDSHGDDLIVATAPTLELVLARCIFETEFRTPSSLRKVNVVHHRDLIANGELQYTEGDHPFFKDRCPKLNWSYADLRAPGDTGAISKDSFFKTLYSVEKNLDSQWSKQNRLESELGM